MRIYITICCLVGIGILSACGRMSAVQKPENAVYPETYAVKL